MKMNDQPFAGDCFHLASQRREEVDLVIDPLDLDCLRLDCRLAAIPLKAAERCDGHQLGAEVPGQVQDD
jgi:hypothetical protein